MLLNVFSNNAKYILLYMYLYYQNVTNVCRILMDIKLFPGSF